MIKKAIGDVKRADGFFLRKRNIFFYFEQKFACYYSNFRIYYI